MFGWFKKKISVQQQEVKFYSAHDALRAMEAGEKLYAFWDNSLRLFFFINQHDETKQLALDMGFSYMDFLPGNELKQFGKFIDKLAKGCQWVDGMATLHKHLTFQVSSDNFDWRAKHVQEQHVA